ncbi:PepSY domain-containing protein [Ascidiimonas sp. W6]|uniref:PepSY domain-containing protein n=1 Tax=Ascidiimonas meishanensis TaxID=3128903 RepID=UPI0030ED4EEE
MVPRKVAIRIRKTHRYLGIFLGIQFLMWTVSGLYFSWTDIDEIHGDHLRNPSPQVQGFDSLISPDKLPFKQPIFALELREIASIPYYWINKEVLVNAHTGILKKGITKEEAIAVANQQMKEDLKVSEVERILKTDKHHEYRGRPLPAYVISYKSPENVKAYVSEKDGAFQRVRHQSWRWFDFLWMTHTMDYEGRDNFNTTLLRIFSLMGVFTVLSGFSLWLVSSPTMRKLFKPKSD